MLDSFDAVFYSSPVPSSWSTLTYLALVFDKVYFPGVYIPVTGIDSTATMKEFERIRALGRSDIETSQMLNCMVYALNASHLKDFCVFTGEQGWAGKLEEGADELARGLEVEIFGAPEPNFTPVLTQGFAKGLPGVEVSVNGPSWITYPANALIFSINKNLPLINDNPELPVPSVGNVTCKSNASVLARILAIECVRLVLPRIPPLTPPEIEDFRGNTKDIVKTFRTGMLKLSKDLNSVIQSDASLEDVMREAKFIVETSVFPEMEELRRVIEEPPKPWTRRTVDFVKSVPEMVGNFATLPKSMAAAKALAKLAEVFADIRDDQFTKENKVKRGVYHYLLKIEKELGSRQL